MSSFNNPAGPQSRGVYFRRRLLVGLGLLVVILVIVLIVVRPGGETPTGSSSEPATTTTAPATTAPTPSGAASSTPTNAAPAIDGQCAPDDITVTAITDAASYAAGANPLLSLSVVNNADQACTMSVGSDVQEFRITSGEELIWSSKDCQTDPVAATAELEPGVSVATTPFAWNRTASVAGMDCDAERTAVTAEGASYHLEVVLDGAESANTKQFVLN